MSEKPEKFLIKVTNFINPHLFHFKLENIVGLFDTDIQNRLTEHAKGKQWEFTNGYHPQQDEVVSAFILEWSKWVRAQVDVILDEGQTKQYVVWCMDQGVPMKLCAQYLLPIPEELKYTPGTAFVGGLAKCIPLETRLNFATMKHETSTIDDFPEFVVNTARTYLEEADQIFFTPRQKIDSHIFGDIQITHYNGNKVDLLRELIKKDGVKIDDNYIPLGIGKLETLKKNRYENHHGHLNVRNVVKPHMNMRLGRKYPSKISVCSNDLDEEEKMVLDWSRQNNAHGQEMEHILKRQFDQIINSLDVYAKSGEIEHEPFPRMYNLGSLHSVNNSNWTLGLDRCDSRSTLTEVQSSAVVTKCEKPRMSRLTERLKATSISSNSKPKIVKETKKTVFIPSGFERDILDFQKYNQI